GRCARTPDGHPAGFGSLFEEQMKLGAIMACCAAVTWKQTAQGGWVSVESVDPREYWIDPKQRGLYRRRHYEIDKHELIAMASRVDEAGMPIYNLTEIQQLGTEVDELSRINRETSTGTGQGTDQGRKPIQIDEWRATIILDDGRIAADRALHVVANGKFLIRGPEVNPYWHNEDWLVFTPMVSVPMSVYGRTYMEDWAPMADAFIEMTNLILDAATTATLKAFAAQPELLADPTQLAEGISPNMVFQMAEGVIPTDFLKEIELGNLPQEAVAVWQALKGELRDGAKLSEMALGQMPGKSRITAQEIAQVSQSGSAMIRSMAKTIEERFLEPVLTLVWQTALQYMDFMSLANEIGEDTAMMLQAQRQQFQQRRIKFRVRGISGLIDRQSKLSNLLAFFQTVAQNQLLFTALMQNINVARLLQSLIALFGVDPKLFEYTPQEKMQQQAMAAMQPPQPQPQQRQAGVQRAAAPPPQPQSQQAPQQ
ncbi:MAG TPA: hypothetical protein VFY39_04585, partial [Gammaproteobacteria bacterium]|nr:hypothetical protein [Gammaproteobacteria bacterium]